MTITDELAASKAAVPDNAGCLAVRKSLSDLGELPLAAPQPWEDRLIELESRVAQLDAENCKLRETCAVLEQATVTYAKLHQEVAVGFVTLDCQGTIVNLNRAAAALLGRSKSRLRHRPFALLLSSEELLRFLAQVAQCVQSRRVVTGEFVLCGPDNRPQLVQLSFAPVLDAGRRVIRLEAVLVDITDRMQPAECLRRAYSELELRVLERTAQLARSNEQLQLEITSRNRTQEALAESGRRFRQLAENIGEVFWMTDTEKRQMLYISPGYEQIWGRSCESLYQSPQSWLEAIHPEDRDRVLEAALTRQLSGEYSEEYRIIRPDGTIRWIQDRAFPIRDESGHIYRVTGIAQDITARKEAQEILRESESRFRALFESMPIGIALHDANGHITQTNLAYQRMLGYTDEELRQLGAKRVTHPDDVAEGQQFYGEMQAGKRDHYQRQKRYVRKDGGIVWAQSTASTVRNARGELRFVISMVEDITERRQAEMARAHLAAIVESSYDSITATTLDGTIISWNKGAERLYGHSADEILGRPLALLVPPDRQDELGQILERLNHGEIVEPFETVRLHKDGRPIHVALTLSPVRDAAGRIVGASSVARDISEHKRLQSEILRVSDCEQHRIAQDLHDGLGQQLAGIFCLSSALQKDLAARSAPETACAEMIVEQLETASAQTRSLARGLYPVESEPNALMLALRELASRTRKIFKINCCFHCPRPVRIEDNNIATHLYRIAQEAVTNAIKHGQARRVSIGLRSSPPQLILTVKDDGVGMDRSVRPPSGMGLRIMDYRARMIGGTLTVSKGKAGGTKVICALKPPAHPSSQ